MSSHKPIEDIRWTPKRVALVTTMNMLASPTLEHMASAKSEGDSRRYFAAYLSVVEYVLSEIPELAGQLQSDQVAKDLIDSAKRRRDGVDEKEEQ